MQNNVVLWGKCVDKTMKSVNNYSEIKLKNTTILCERNVMRNILIIEDKDSHMRALEKILSGIDDIQVFKAYDMQGAYHMLSLHYFNLFLVDIVLDTSNPSDASGLDFVKEIRNNKKYEFTPVIFITSLEDPEIIAYKQLHCADYIEKPFDETRVKEAVMKALQFPMREMRDENFYIRKDGIVYSLKYDEILWVKITRKSTTIYTVRDYIEIPYKKAADMLKELKYSNFVQCSRFAIINMNYVEMTDFTNRYIKLRGVKDNIEIGSTEVKRLMEIFDGKGM